MRKLNPRMGKILTKMVTRAVQLRNAPDGGNPFLLGHFVTNRCNNKCKSCLWRHNDWEDVPLDDLKEFYVQAAEAGFLGTFLSGGEPLLRNDIGELARFIKEETEMAILFITSGWFLEERMDEVLPHIDMMMWSIDSPNAERHDEIRGMPGLFGRLMKGIERIKKEYPDMSCQTNCCVQKGLADEIDDLLNLHRDLDVQISFDIISDFRHDGEGGHYTETDMGMPLPELRGVCEHLIKRKSEGAPVLNSERYFKYFLDGKPGYKCHLPKLAMCVDGRGYVEDCLDMKRPIANIRETEVEDILELPRFRALRARAEECCTCNSPTMIDLSNVWENPQLVFEEGGIAVG